MLIVMRGKGLLRSNKSCGDKPSLKKSSTYIIFANLVTWDLFTIDDKYPIFCERTSRRKKILPDIVFAESNNYQICRKRKI
jgi:hypothetical protein